MALTKLLHACDARSLSPHNAPSQRHWLLDGQQMRHVTTASSPGRVRLEVHLRLRGSGYILNNEVQELDQGSLPLVQRRNQLVYTKTFLPGESVFA